MSALAVQELRTLETRRRLLLQARAREDEAFRASALAACRRDVALWLHDWGWTYDPRLSHPYLPLVPFPAQAEYLAWRDEVVRDKAHGLVEKSRDMGVTWLNIAWHLHRWLFLPGFKGALGSRKEALVDDMRADSMMGKIDILLDWLPSWQVPLGYSRRRHRSHLRMQHPTSGALITGEAGDNMGRGGRSSVYDVDEHAHLERADVVEAAICANADVIFRTSTPNGEGNAFHRLRQGGGVRVFTLHWRQDPRKDQAWYDSMCAKLGDSVLIARELDIDYAGSLSDVLIERRWTSEAQGRMLYPREPQALVLGLDVARYGADSSALAVREGRNLLGLERWKGLDLSDLTGRVAASADRWAERLHKLRRVAPEVLYIVVDSTGMGAGVADNLRAEARRRKREGHPCDWVVLDCDAGEKAPDDHTVRYRDYLWWRSREYWRTGEPAIAADVGPLLGDLLQQLSAPRYRYTPDGRVLVESKDEMRKRGVSSPDVADAFNLTFHAQAIKPATEASMGPRYMRAHHNRSGMVG